MPSNKAASDHQPKDNSREQIPGEVVVLTGSSGCLGIQTLKLLISRDDKVAEIRCLDLVEPSGWAKQSVEAELAKFESSVKQKQNGSVGKRVRYIRGDIRDINTVEACLDGADCVIHCAAKVDIWVDPDDQDENELESVNLHGTENLLKACVLLGVPKFVHVSSFEVFVNYHTIYYATESTLPGVKRLLFGASGQSKLDAETIVRQYSNNKLKQVKQNPSNGSPSSKQPADSLNAVILRFTPVYGPGDKYYVSKILEIAKCFNGTLKRFTNVWIRQQPIYVGNAAWSLIKAKQRMDCDESISGEEFHITDDTKIGDPFDFIEPIAESKGIRMSSSSLPALPVWFLFTLFTFIRKSLVSLDIFNLFTHKKSRLEEAKEKDRIRKQDVCGNQEETSKGSRSKRWYHLVTPQMFYFMCNSLFLNRTKAGLRLEYEPIFGPDESMEVSLEWYKNHLEL